MAALPKSKRFQAAAASRRDDDEDPLDAAAARLLARESREVVALPYDSPPPRSRIALHNGRFLRATLQSTERHNQRLARSEPPQRRSRTTSALPPPREAPARPTPTDERRHVDVVLSDEDAGIMFERDAETGRPVVRGLAASARPDIARAVAPGMVLSKIAGVKCKPIDYKASLDLIRALEKPLTLTFKRPQSTPSSAKKSKKTRDKEESPRPKRDDERDDSPPKKRRRHRSR